MTEPPYTTFLDSEFSMATEPKPQERQDSSQYFLEAEEDTQALNNRLLLLGVACILCLRRTPDPSPYCPGKGTTRWPAWGCQGHTALLTKIAAVRCWPVCLPSEKVLTTLATVLSVKWESSDSAAAGKAMPSLLESLVESSLDEEEGGQPRGKCTR